MRRDRVELEQRRMTAARLLERGQSEAEVARRLGVSRQSVNRWPRPWPRGTRGAAAGSTGGAAAQAQRNRAATGRALSAAGS